MLLGIGAAIVITTRETLVPANSVAEHDALPRSTELLETGTRQAIGGPAWLDVRVAGSALWTRAGAVSTFLATAHSPPSSWDGAHATVSYADGTARVSTDASVWTWVRVQPADPAGPSALVRVPPFVGTQALHVVLPDTAALHVLVLQADGLTPASATEVLVEQRMPTNQFTVIARGTTDAAGYARLADCLRGRLTRPQRPQARGHPPRRPPRRRRRADGPGVVGRVLPRRTGCDDVGPGARSAPVEG